MGEQSSYIYKTKTTQAQQRTLKKKNKKKITDEYKLQYICRFWICTVTTQWKSITKGHKQPNLIKMNAL